MNWYVVAALFVIAIVVYKAVSSGPSKAAAMIAEALSVKPHLVETMITEMGSDQGLKFTQTLNARKDDFLEDAVYTFFIYQVLKNPHHKNIEWWRGTLSKSEYDPELNATRVDVALSFLRHAGAGDIYTSQFLKEYEANLHKNPST